MNADSAPPATGRITVGQTADGTLTYLVDLAPDAVPAVSRRDLHAAWDAARSAALAERWGAPRLFRFRREGGEPLDLAIADADAGCWAGAVDATAGLGTMRGLALCLRLLALVDLLARAPWARALLALRRDGAELDPSLVAAAAAVPLGADARFEPARMQAALAAAAPARLPSPSPFRPHGPATGACA